LYQAEFQDDRSFIRGHTDPHTAAVFWYDLNSIANNNTVFPLPLFTISMQCANLICYVECHYVHH